MRNLIVFLLISVFCQAQETSLYYVIKVDGSIINVNQDKNLSTGDRILASDNLKFQTSNASALAISENSEKFSLKQPSSIDVISGAGDSFPVMLSATPVISRNQLSIRGEQDMDREIVDLKSYFGKENFAIIGDSLSVKLDEEIYPLNNNKFIVFYYNIDDEQVSKKVGFNRQRLVIEKDKLMQGKENKLEGNKINGIEVFQYEMSSQKSEKITEFNLLFVTDEDLKEEFDAIMPVLTGLNMTNEEMQSYLINYFTDVYGLTDQNSIVSFVDDYLTNLN